MQWNTQPLWVFFEAHGINVAIMTPKPLEGPVMVARDPAPQPVVPSAEAAELQQKAREVERQWNKLNRKIDRMTGRGWRWS